MKKIKERRKGKIYIKKIIIKYIHKKRDPCKASQNIPMSVMGLSSSVETYSSRRRFILYINTE